MNRKNKNRPLAMYVRLKLKLGTKVVSFLLIAKSTLMLSAKSLHQCYVSFFKKKFILRNIKTRTTFFETFIFKESGYLQNDKKESCY